MTEDKSSDSAKNRGSRPESTFLDWLRENREEGDVPVSEAERRVNLESNEEIDRLRGSASGHVSETRPINPLPERQEEIDRCLANTPTEAERGDLLKEKAKIQDRLSKDKVQKKGGFIERTKKGPSPNDDPSQAR